MASRSPSYIYQSPHGIWYFQVWIPTQFREKCGRKKLIRKSLGTRNRKHALRLARELWVKVEKQKYDWEDQAERDIAVEERLYFKGKSLSAQVEEEGIDLTNPYEKDNFFETLTDWEIKALAFYENYQFEQRQPSEPQPAAIRTSDPQDPKPDTDPVPVSQASPAPLSGSNHRISDIVEKWVHFNTNVRKKNPWKPKTVKKYRADVGLFVNMVGNPFAHELTKERIRDLYEERLPIMPKDIVKKKIYHSGSTPVLDDDGKPEFYANGRPKTEPIWKSIDEILEIAEKTKDARYDPGTVVRSAMNIRNFLKWAEKKEYLQPNLRDVLEDLANSADIKEEKGTHFTPDDLKQLFENETYQKGLLFKLPYRHWIPLLLLFTGARLGEISQLRVEDIQRIDGVWTILIRQYDESSTVKGKDETYVRKVPLHKELEKLEFRKFVDQVKAKGETHLFPVLRPAEGSDDWGSDAGKWFNGTYLDQCGIAKVAKVDGRNKRKTLHSFRYTWITGAKHAKLDPEMSRELSGHASGLKSDVHNNYEGDYPLVDRKKAMNKIAFDFDVEAIKKWR